MTVIRRMFGVVDDAVAGGSDYDTLAAGAIPNATAFWPVTGGTLDRNIERLDRNAEVRGRRAATPPISFRAAPMVTVPVMAYSSIIGKALKKTLGGADTVTGSAAPYTHTFGILQFGQTALPALHVQLVRDDLNHKMSGGSFNRLSLSFPLDGEGTAEMEIWGKYHAHFPDALPSVTFSEPADVFMLRDAKAFIDGSSIPVPDLQGFDFTFVNNLTRKPYAGRNIVTQTLGSPVQTKRLWFPAENKVGASQDVTYSIQFGNTVIAQEIAHDFSQIQKFVFQVQGETLASGGRALLRITLYNTVATGGGADALTARDDITARFDGGAFYSELDSADIKVELVNDVSAPYT